MNILVRISVDKISLGKFEIVALECGSSVHTWEFKAPKILGIIPFELDNEIVVFALRWIVNVLNEFIQELENKHGNKV